MPQLPPVKPPPIRRRLRLTPLPHRSSEHLLRHLWHARAILPLPADCQKVRDLELPEMVCLRDPILLPRNAFHGPVTNADNAGQRVLCDHAAQMSLRHLRVPVLDDSFDELGEQSESLGDSEWLCDFFLGDRKGFGPFACRWDV